MLRWNGFSLYSGSVHSIRGITLSKEFYIDFWFRGHNVTKDFEESEIIKFEKGLDLKITDKGYAKISAQGYGWEFVSN